MMGQRTWTCPVQPVYWKGEKLLLIFPLFWKFAPSGINCLISYSFTTDSLPTSTCKGPALFHIRFKYYHDIVVPYCLQEIWAICRKHSCCLPPSPLLQYTTTVCCYSTRTSAFKCIWKIQAPKDIKITSPNAINGNARSHCHPNGKDKGGAARALPNQFGGLSQPSSSHHFRA